jgi:hypothetical protein
MSDFDPSEFSVNWADRSDSTFYAIDGATYPFRVNNINWTKTGENSANPGQPMAKVTLEFPEVRTTKPKRGRPKGSTETEVVTERNRTLPQYFTFSSEFAVEQARKFLIAMEVATGDELEEKMDGPTIIKLFDATQGGEGAARVTKAPQQREGAPSDENGMTNNVRQYYAKGTVQYERALAATGAGISADQVTFAGKKKR